MQFTAPPLRLAGVLVLCLALPGSAVLGAGFQSQAPPTEAELTTLIAAEPAAPAPYLALAQIYIEQGRFDDAQQMISNALALTRRLAAAAGPSRPVRIGGDIQEPVKIKDVEPVYPAEARAAKVSGIVIVELLVDRQGDVAGATVLRSIESLDQAALDAVKQWQFLPTVIGGQPVEVLMTVTVNFTLGR